LTLTKLKDGRIFVFGENQAEIYDSKTGKFKFVGNSKCNFDDNALALLPDGKVIIMGRASEKIKEEIFSTKEELISNYKSEGLDLNPKFIYKWFFLPNGTIIKTENFESKFKKTTSKVRTSEIYNPSTDKFTLGSNMVEPRINPKALTLKDGKILVLVGNRTNGKPYQDTEIYDPKFNKFVAVRKMEKQRSCGLSPVLFTDGRVYLVSNDYYPREQLFDWFIKLESTCEIYNPNNQSFKFTDKCIKPLKGGNIPILLPNEELLIFGGSNPRMSNLQERKIEIVDTKGIK